VVIVRDPGQNPAEIAWQAAKIGYDNIVGELDGGMDAWVYAGHDAAGIALNLAGDLGGRRVLDIRQRMRHTSARHRPRQLPADANIWILCRTFAKMS
jgi:hydroxyacylglutathione hydrolase